MIKNFPREDRGQLKDDGNYHLKAIQIGKRYIYFEDYFTSSEAVFLGGLIAGSAARRIKTIIYDRKKQVFNLFRNARDFEKFIKEEHPEYLDELEKQANDIVTNEVSKNKKKKRKKRKKRVENLKLIKKIIFDINNK